MDILKGIIMSLCCLAIVSTCAASDKSKHSIPITISKYNSLPTLFIDGKPQPALFHFSEEVPEHYAQEFRKAGFVLYSSIDKGYYLDLGWKDEGVFDFTRLDRVISTFTQRVPDGYLLPKIHLWAPEWWMDKHSDQAVGFEVKPENYDYVIASGPKHESFASELWREEAGKGLREMVRHILESSYADKVMGIFIAGGTFGEWHPWQWTPEGCIDNSEPMRKAFIRYLREKYNNDPNKLQHAWGESDIAFENVSVPKSSERLKKSDGFFMDPHESRKITDYYEAFHETVVHAVDYFCRIVKDESKGRFLTCVNYAYPPDIPWAIQQAHHRAGIEAVRLKSIDVFTSPHSYYYRDLGEHGALRCFTQSLALHGKLFIDETDERTHLADKKKVIFGHADNMEESLAIIWRSFGNVVTQGVGMWYMDHTSGEWFDDPAFFRTFKKIKKLADDSINLPRKRVSEVAVISSAQSEFYLARETDLTAQFTVSQLEQLCRSGAPFDRYFIEDLEDGLLPDYKVYLFLDNFYLTLGQREAINKLKSKDRTLIWFYAPGFVTQDKLSLEAMEQLIEINFKKSNNPFDHIKIGTPLISNTSEQFIMWRENFGKFNKKLNPRFIPTDPLCEIWGTYADNGKPALVRKKLDHWTSVYSPTGKLPWQILNQIYKNAGVHLYCENGDNLSVNESWLSLHAANSGYKTIILPKHMDVYDAIDGQPVDTNTNKISVPLAKGRTSLFLLLEPSSKGHKF